MSPSGLPRTRHTADGPSARSLLITVLGEYVVPAGTDAVAWGRALVEALQTLGFEDKAARQAIARLAREGWLTKEAAGGADGESRQVCWAVTEMASSVLGEEANRFGRSFRDPGPWDERWLLIAASVPETQRALRQQLRSRLTFEGFGSLGQGWWISADPRAEAAAEHVLARLGLLDSAVSFVARSGALGDVNELVASTWNLDEAQARYEKLIDELSGLDPTDEAEAFVTRTRMVNQWRRALAVDPRLPRELLPPDWAGTRATEVYRQLYGRWHTPAAAWWHAHNRPR